MAGIEKVPVPSLSLQCCLFNEGPWTCRTPPPQQERILKEGDVTVNTHYERKTPRLEFARADFWADRL